MMSGELSYRTHPHWRSPEGRDDGDRGLAARAQTGDMQRRPSLLLFLDEGIELFVRLFPQRQ